MKKFILTAMLSLFSLEAGLSSLETRIRNTKEYFHQNCLSRQLKYELNFYEPFIPA